VETATGGTRWLADGLGQVDVRFQGEAAVIAVYVLDTSDGLALIDCGPSTTIDTLLAGLRELGLDPARMRHILLTHIHLDHAGAGGSLLQRFPAARLYVHEVGAPHMADPSKLVTSAQRIYGAEMDSLWGAVAAVPAERMVVLRDGDNVELGGRRLNALYTPGHASHHIAFHDQAARVIFAGDVAGVRIPPAAEVWPPTPPPDIDPVAWHASVARLRAAAPTRLLLAHFGAVDDIAPHLDQLEARLDEWVAFVDQARGAGLARDAIVAQLARHARGGLDAGDDPQTEARFAIATPYGMTVDGLLRYLRLRDEGRMP
jgi:glyoxylase-like metal-dependent hydrolase (beta-lactamase superfamily II)